MLIRRLAAAAAIVLAAASVITGLVATITTFPRGLFVLLLLAFALIAAWHGVLRRGLLRWISIGAAVVALIAAIALLVSGHPIETALFVVTGVAAIVLARAAFVVHVHLPDASPPKRPVLIYNPKSGGGKATRFSLADQARSRGFEPIELTWDTTLEAIVQDALARGAERHAEQRHEEDQPDQAAPKRAADRPRAGHGGLMELDLSALLALDDDEVLEVDHAAVLGLGGVGRDFLRRLEAVVTNGDKITHPGSLLIDVHDDCTLPFPAGPSARTLVAGRQRTR